jgi:endonuclease/exonuclease/phosphatase (EEP) superfamily protein YafD
MTCNRAAYIRLVSWNVFNENLEVSRVVDALKELRPDVALLQEATDAHLEGVASLYPHLERCRDYALRGEMCRLAIASSRPLQNVRVVAHFDDEKPPGSWLARRTGWVEFLDTISADVSVGGSALRLVLLHTSAGAPPTVRRRELEAASVHIPSSGACLVAADFNAFASPWLAPILALPLGYSWSDWRVSELKDNDAFFRRFELAPAVRGVTFPRFRLQMDQIYFRRLRLGRAEIIRRLWGSDHRPILIEAATDHQPAPDPR